LLCFIDVACGKKIIGHFNHRIFIRWHVTEINLGLLDIPIYPGHRVHSLHLLLTLYSEIGRLQK
jgi:hypothetical protein